MGKQRRLEEINAQREAGTYRPPEGKPDRVVEIFRGYYEKALGDMAPEHAAAIGADAVQRHLATEREKASRPLPPVHLEAEGPAKAGGDAM